MDDGPIMEMDTKQEPEHFVGNFSIHNCCSSTFTGILPKSEAIIHRQTFTVLVEVKNIPTHPQQPCYPVELSREIE